MSQEYRIIQFTPSDFKDQMSNFWCDVVFEGVSEPCKWVMQAKTIPTIQVGEAVYGHIEQMTSKAGKTYNRFKKDQLPEKAPDPQTPATTHSAPAVDWDAKDRNIRAQFAIKAAIAYGTPETPLADIEASAKAFYAMVDRVAGSNTQNDSEMPEDFLKGIDY